MAAPRSIERLDDKILGWKNDGIEFVVSLLEPTEITGLNDAEAALCEEFGIEFLSFPIRDKSVPPSLESFAELVRKIAGEISFGRAVAIHCRAGIGRSTILAACILTWLGIDSGTALDMIAEARGVEVPETEAQRQWILAFQDIARSLQR
jgi:protein-tyrosine phosphatase